MALLMKFIVILVFSNLYVFAQNENSGVSIIGSRCFLLLQRSISFISRVEYYLKVRVLAPLNKHIINYYIHTLSDFYTYGVGLT